jgi:adenosine deaminase
LPTSPSWRFPIKPLVQLTPRSEWVQSLPKIELHLHLEGAMRPGTVREMSLARQGWSGPLPDGWEKTYYTYTDFAGFMSQLTPRTPFRPDEWARVARECFEDEVVRNVVYLEASFDVPTREIGDDSRFWPIVEALEEERLRAQARFGIRINFIGGLMRGLPPEVAAYRVELIAEARDRGFGVVAIDLHGDELADRTASFERAYDLAREKGLGMRVHAGEAVGPESIWEAIDVLGTRRIAHGVRCVEDPTLVERLRDGDITLEICPTSNVRTSIFPTIESHPVRCLYDRGVPIAISSDDPLPFFTDVVREYRTLVEVFGFTAEELRRININAANAACISSGERERLVELIGIAYDSAEAGVVEPAS